METDYQATADEIEEEELERFLAPVEPSKKTPTPTP